MAKQLIISVMEDIIGEYVLNISKENLKIAVLRGKLKLTNVQLDGDLIGSHVLGAVGLSGFGVLSCWAKSVKITVPLNNIEKEPTRFEIYGIHLLCVPLLPATAHRQYGAGTALEPRCSLRTRAKRSALARYERNFFSGRIPGEGPPNRRIRNALRRAERRLKKNKDRRQSPEKEYSELLLDEGEFDFTDIETASRGETGDDNSAKAEDVPDKFVLPPRDWMTRLREKVLRNIEASMKELHVRCEVPEGGLDFQAHGKQSSNSKNDTINQRAFAFGITLGCLTATTDNDRRIDQAEDSVMSTQGLKAQKSFMDIRHKVAEINDLSIYWDDNPPVLITESYILRRNNHKLSANKLQAKITAAMDEMFKYIAPTEATQMDLFPTKFTSKSKKDHEEQRKTHCYCLDSFNARLRGTIGDRNQFGPIPLFAQFLPLHVELSFDQVQYIQYKKLRSAMLSQQRFDTMLRQRPSVQPKTAPTVWWKYIIACVTTRPNSRPWEDVQKISRCRNRYIELVKKKVQTSPDGHGFHGGLTEEESSTLLSFEDLLPIEALFAFHLVALRSVYEESKKVGWIEDGEENSSDAPRPQGKKPGRKNPFSRVLSFKRKNKIPEVRDDTDETRTSESSKNINISKASVVEAIRTRLGKKEWHTKFLLDDAKFSISLRQGEQALVRVELRLNGSIKTFGRGRQEVKIDLVRFEIFDSQTQLSSFTPYDAADRGKILMFEKGSASGDSFSHGGRSKRETSPTPPPSGIACRLSAVNSAGSLLSLSISAHPATLVWNKPCIDSVLDFLATHRDELQTSVTKQLRNMATPLARKASMALLSPSAIKLKMNIAAPKVWFPVSSESTDGSVYLDAGKLRLSFSKAEGKADTVWNVNARDIQVMFVRKTTVKSMSPSAQLSENGANSIIRPFHVHIEALKADKELSIPEWNPIYASRDIMKGVTGPWRKVDVAISPICLNLIDAEVLARSFGKWYSNGLIRVRRRNLRMSTSGLNMKKDESKQNKNKSTSSDAALKSDEKSEPSGVTTLSLCFERFEMVLEGHSKNPEFDFCADDQSVSTAAADWFGSQPKKRTYVVKLSRLMLGHLSCNGISRIRFLVSDVSITRLRDDSRLVPSNELEKDPQHKVLVRTENDDRTNDVDDASLIWQNFDDNSAMHPFTNSRPNSTVSSAGHVLCVSILRDKTQHLDEIEIDMKSVIFRITPTSLKDCIKAVRRILEVVHVVTKEMERRVHEEGRRARERDSSGKFRGHHARNPALSPKPRNKSKPITESSILFRATLNEVYIMAGRPFQSNKSRNAPNDASCYAVVQLVSNALVMFQSVENGDGSGCRTLHASIDDLSAIASTEFARCAPTQISPMIEPTAAEFRIVYATELQGCVVSQDVSLDCEQLKMSTSPQDIYITASVVDRILQRLRNEIRPGARADNVQEEKQGASGLGALVRYQKKGSGIATSIRLEIQSVSIVLLHSNAKQRSRPLFNFSMLGAKGLLGGCMTALSGELTSTIALSHYNSDLADWESTVEPSHVSLSLDQMPNEIVTQMTIPSQFQMNVTSAMLRDIPKIDTSLFRNKFGTGGEDLKSFGIRRNIDSPSISIENKTGLDFVISLSSPYNDKSPGKRMLVESGRIIALDSLFPDGALEKASNRKTFIKPRFTIRFAPSASALIGEREIIRDLILASSSMPRVRKIVPAFPRYGKANDFHLLTGRASPETTLSDISGIGHSDYAYYNAEPVVEWCMQNQRLRSNVVDVYSLSRGRDILSSTVWSPEDCQPAKQGHTFLAETELSLSDSSLFVENENSSIGTKDNNSRDSSTQENESKYKKTTTTIPSRKGNWLRPYLKNDSPEWTDMTCILRLDRDRVMLPDNHWIWLNNWTVDIGGRYGETTDCDGWEYEADFETFNRKPRYYKRGDSCRRRRWTRTRMVRPPPLNDPFRPLSLVWDPCQDEDENFLVHVKSNVQIHNRTDDTISCLVSSPSWEEKNLGVMKPHDKLHVPILLSTATHLRIGVHMSKAVGANVSVATSRKILIVPTGHSSNTITRVAVGVSSYAAKSRQNEQPRRRYFIVNLKSSRGIIDISIIPVLHIVNLLPCELSCELGEVFVGDKDDEHSRRKVVGPKNTKVLATETRQIQPGEEGHFTTVNARLKPHLSLRVPGYNWSQWHPIINRKSNSMTWQPSETEEELHEGDADFAEEFKSIVFFERLGVNGDPLNLILSVEMGHSPTIRVYAQYWILDKTGFGCGFCDGFADILSSLPETETSRKSYIRQSEFATNEVQQDMTATGYQWSIGMEGMSLYFSRREKIALRIEKVDSMSDDDDQSLLSNWINPMDISNVIPKTVFSVDECNGHRRFELAISVTVCPSIFGRTRLITFLPRYQIVNLLDCNLVVAQDCWLKKKVTIPPSAAIPYHWERHSLPPKVRLAHSLAASRRDKNELLSWTNGCIQLDKIGITSMRFPFKKHGKPHPVVVQAEVRLATKDQSSAVVIVVWSTDEKSNPLYVIRNNTSRTILCRQPLHDDIESIGTGSGFICETETTSMRSKESQHVTNGYECGGDLGKIIKAFLGLDRIDEFVWVIRPKEKTCFGFDDPEKLHILEWACAVKSERFDSRKKNAFIEVDAMGSTSTLVLPDGTEIRCQIRAEHSTKVIEFVEYSKRSKKNSTSRQTLERLVKSGKHIEVMLNEQSGRNLYPEATSVEDEEVTFSFRFDVPAIAISVVDNASSSRYGREILLIQFDKLAAEVSRNSDGYHHTEIMLQSLQVDNHVHNCVHPVLLFCPQLVEKEPFLHLSVVRRLRPLSFSSVFRYAAIRILDIEIFLDRRTAESIASFIRPIGESDEVQNLDPRKWIREVTNGMVGSSSRCSTRASRDIESIVATANSGRIYFEQLHLHPVKLSLTFTQEWMEWKPGGETMLIFQFIKGMASIANAPLKFTSFMVGHVFESPYALVRIVQTHYASQLTKQIFGILGSLAILEAPADFISNVGTGVRDFFYEPINGLVHGPSQFIEGLEAGTQSLARGVFVGVVRGAANVTEVVNTNLAGLTADDDFIDERKAHQRLLTDAMSRGAMSRTITDSLYLAGASVARGVKSGAYGILEQPALYASKHGPVGFVKGVGKAIVGAIVKPVVGVGDAAVLVMNHVSDATSDKQIIPKIPKRLRRALPRASVDKPFKVRLSPFDDKAAKAQKIVTAGLEDEYVGHVVIPSHLIIASDQCLWAIDKTTREPWCISWEEISHFRIQNRSRMRICVFSQTGLRSRVFQVDDSVQFAEFHRLLAMQAAKMGNSTHKLPNRETSVLLGGLESVSKFDFPGVKAKQVNHVFGSCNMSRKRLPSTIKDEIDVIEQCFARVKMLGSESRDFFRTLDEESWTLIHFWGQVFSGLSSRRCIAASIINGTGYEIQIKSSKLVEGGSPCYSIPSKEYDSVQGVLRPGGAIIFFGWGVVPNLLQAGNVFMSIESNAFVAELSDKKTRDTSVEPLSGYEVGFLEKSYDESGWWAKYWLVIRKV